MVLPCRVRHCGVTTVAHFLLYTPQGSLILVLVGSSIVAVVVWLAFQLLFAALVFAVWLLLRAIRQVRGSPHEFPRPETR
jgi:hypothetical protein